MPTLVTDPLGNYPTWLDTFTPSPVGEQHVDWLSGDGVACQAPAACTSTGYPAFSVPHEIRAHSGRLWLRPSFALPGSEAEVELHLKGANWGGFEAPNSCVEQLSAWTEDDYMSMLQRRRFNAVRLPLSLRTLYRYVMATTDWRGNPKYECGPYSYGSFRGGSKAFVLEALESVLRKLGSRGIWVTLDMHHVHWEFQNEGLWCFLGQSDTQGCRPAPPGTSCARAVDPVVCAFRLVENGTLLDTEAPIIATWEMLAHKFCSHPNVIMADIFNEPHGGHWGDPQLPRGKDWRAAATRIANAILAICPRCECREF